MSVKNINMTYKVWSRFHVTRKDGRVIKVRIQELPWRQHKDEIAKFFMKYFIKNEAFYKAAGISNNEEAITEYQEFLFSYCDENGPHVSLCFVDDDSNTNDILGMSLLNVVNDQPNNKKIKDFKPKTKELQNLIDIISVTNDINKVLDTNKAYLISKTHILVNILKRRKPICIENDIPMSCAWMTSIGTQKAAVKYNWKTFKEIPVEEFERKTGLPFKADTSIFKLMYTTKE